jgi:hypothetical protein
VQSLYAALPKVSAPELFRQPELSSAYALPEMSNSHQAALENIYRLSRYFVVAGAFSIPHRREKQISSSIPQLLDGSRSFPNLKHAFYLNRSYWFWQAKIFIPQNK